MEECFGWGWGWCRKPAFSKLCVSLRCHLETLAHLWNSGAMPSSLEPQHQGQVPNKEECGNGKRCGSLAHIGTKQCRGCSSWQCQHYVVPLDGGRSRNPQDPVKGRLAARLKIINDCSKSLWCQWPISCKWYFIISGNYAISFYEPCYDIQHCLYNSWRRAIIHLWQILQATVGIFPLNQVRFY